MLSRLGTAMIVLGLIAMIVFLLGNSIGQGDVRVLLGGAAACAVGLILHRRAAGAAPRSTRFRTVRRIFGQDDDEADDE